LVKFVQLDQPKLVQPELAYATVTIDHQMVVQVGKKIINDVLIDGGFGINIIIENLVVQLGLSKLNLMLYNLRVAN
jgi:hypothetical protein